MSPLDCIENTSWEDYSRKTCADYAKNKMCENGRIGSSVPQDFYWPSGSNLLDARSACCVCGGNRISGNVR